MIKQSADKKEQQRKTGLRKKLIDKYLKQYIMT